MPGKIRKKETAEQYAGRRRRVRERYHSDPIARFKNMRLAYAHMQASRGIDIEDIARAELAQDRCCAICRRPAAGLDYNADHNHRTGTFRGILCRACNLMIGIFKEDDRAFADWLDRLSHGTIEAYLWGRR